MKTRRPDDLPFPKVWSRFSRKSPEGNELKFKIQDCPEEMLEDVLHFMCEYFMKDETLNNAVGIQYDNLAVEEFRNFQSALFPQKLVLVCLKDDEDGEDKAMKPEILGFSLQFVQKKGDENTFVPKSSTIKQLFNLFHEMERLNVTCEAHRVDEYLGDAGLSVHPSMRGLGLGKELLLARILVAKTLGLKVIEATFTSEESQGLAAKLGFKTLVSIPYEDLSKKYDLDFKTKTKYISIMTYFIK